MVRAIPDFSERKGPGIGNKATNEFIRELTRRVREALRDKVQPQAAVTPRAGYTFDFYLPDSNVAIEIALGLRNPLSEFERDVLKALLAKDAGKSIARLVLIGRPGSLLRIDSPGPRAIVEFARRKFAVSVEVRELETDTGPRNLGRPRESVGL